MTKSEFSSSLNFIARMSYHSNRVAHYHYLFLKRKWLCFQQYPRVLLGCQMILNILFYLYFVVQSELKLAFRGSDCFSCVVLAINKENECHFTFSSFNVVYFLVDLCMSIQMLASICCYHKTPHHKQIISVLSLVSSREMA